MSSIEGVVFDVDGTLIDTFEHIVQAFEIVLPEHGATADRQAIAAVIGQTLQQCYESLHPQGDHAAMAARHHEVQQTPDMYALITVHEGLSEALYGLEQHGIARAVLTNRSRHSIDLIFSHLGIRDDFEVIVTPQDVTEPKPDPEGLLVVASKLNIAVSQLAMVGDTAIDVTTGKNAQAGKTIGLTHGFGSKESIKQAGADVIIDGFSRLLPALGVKK